MEIVNITVVIDRDSNECLYIEEEAWSSRGESTVYIADLVTASKGRLINLEHREIDFVHEEWPEKLKNALRRPKKPRYCFGTPQELLASYRAGFVGTVMDHPGCEDWQRVMALEEEDWLGPPDFSRVAQFEKLNQDYAGKYGCGWHARIALSEIYKGRQLQGDDCAWAVRSAVDQSRFNELANSWTDDNDSSTLSATALLWACRQKPEQASSLPRLCVSLLREGILLEKKYSNKTESLDFRDYRNYFPLANKLGGEFPEWLYSQTMQTKLNQVAKINTEEELLTALWNGYGIVCASPLGVSREAGKDLPWIQVPEGTWLRSVAIVGFDDRKEYLDDTIIFWDGSPWAQWSTVFPHDFPGEFQPIVPGMFALTLADTMLYAIQPGQCYAFSGIEPFHPMTLPDYSTQYAIRL